MEIAADIKIRIKKIKNAFVISESIIKLELIKLWKLKFISTFLYEYIKNPRKKEKNNNNNIGIEFTFKMAVRVFKRGIKNINVYNPNLLLITEIIKTIKIKKLAIIKMDKLSKRAVL